MRVFRADWNFPGSLDGEAPLRIEALEPLWNIGEGQHPDMPVNTSFYDPALRKPFEVKKEANIPALIAIHPEGAVTGHVMAADGNALMLIQPDRSAPIAPLFVRDLTGRIIYLGTAPHKQPKQTPEHRFPAGSVLTPQTMPGYDLLEQIYFCPFRFIEPSDRFMGHLSDNPLSKACSIYYGANLYPYKLRPDTFYQEGWRLPQTELLFINPQADAITAEKASSELINLWHNRPKGQTYEAFFEEHEQRFEAFFEAGCTLIPTKEAFNGLNHVGPDFSHQGFWPGRAVSGLHDVAGQKDHEAPAGTILEVLEPGYITGQDLAPARVIVSNGKNYKSPLDPEGSHQKLYPDLRLPHQRTTGKWGATWVPTNPIDFEEPAIWGWDAEYGNSRFLQLRGPLWDPLHYYYTCTPTIIKAFEENRAKRNTNLVKVPDSSLSRFYPATEMRGFDSFNVPLKEARNEALSLLPTSIQWHQDASAVTAVGYHPLPTHYEFELDAWWFPKLAPKYRVSAAIPLNVERSLTSVIRPRISPDKFLATVVADRKTHAWFNDPALLAPLAPDDFENYPYLKRYLSTAGVMQTEINQIMFEYLEDVDTEDCPLLEFDVHTIRKLEEHWPGLYQILLGVRGWSTAFIKARHNLFKNRNKYARALWEITPYTELMKQADEQKDNSAKLPAAALLGAKF